MSSWITESKGWETMNKMLLATVSGGCRFSGGGGGDVVIGPEGEVAPEAPPATDGTIGTVEVQPPQQ